MSKLRSAGIFLCILFLLIGIVNFLIWTDWGSHIDIRLSSNFILGLVAFSAAFSLLYLSIYYNSAPTEPIPPSTTNQSEAKETEETQQPTPAEKRLQNILNNILNPNFPQHTYESQSTQHGYQLEFYFPTLKLAIEIEGKSIHTQETNWQRDSHLLSKGIHVLRINKDQIFSNPQEVANQIGNIIREKDIELGRKESDTT
jgi:very-short-patch-repair endonuclease